MIMKRPLLTEWDREIMRVCPDSLDAQRSNMTIDTAQLKQSFGKSYLIQKVIKPIVEWLSKYLNK